MPSVDRLAPEMRAVLERLLDEDGAQPDPTLLPPAEGRAVAEAANRRWNTGKHPVMAKELIVETTDGHRVSFRLQGGYVVRNARFAVAPHAVAPTLVLSTCWPFEASTRGPWRYVAIAQADSQG